MQSEKFLLSTHATYSVGSDSGLSASSEHFVLRPASQDTEIDVPPEDVRQGGGGTRIKPFKTNGIVLGTTTDIATQNNDYVTQPSSAEHLYASSSPLIRNEEASTVLPNNHVSPINERGEYISSSTHVSPSHAEQESFFDSIIAHTFGRFCVFVFVLGLLYFVRTYTRLGRFML